MLKQVAMFLAFASCTTSRQPLPVDVQPKKMSEDLPPKVLLQKLESTLRNDPSSYQTVADVYHILRAETYEDELNFNKAKEEWLHSLTLAKGEFGKEAFDGWLNSYILSVGKDRNVHLIAKLMFNDSKGLSTSPYLQSKGLSNFETLLYELNKKLNPTLQTLPAPNIRGAPPNDLMMIKVSQNYCLAKIPANFTWKAWENTLAPLTRRYWNALVLSCSGDIRKAIQAFTKLIPHLKKSKNHIAHAITSHEILVKLYIRNAQRAESVHAYRDLIKLWESKGLSPSSFGISDMEFQLKHIDDVLSAARIETVIGEYLKASSHVEKALTLVEKTAFQIRNASPSQLNKLSALKAEAYQVLANRIALEQKEYSRAVNIVKLARNTPRLSAEWDDRFLWTQGIYEYLDKKYENARNLWLEILNDDPDDDMKAKLYYWIAKTLPKQDSKRQDYIDRLNKEFPIHYYTLLAGELSSQTPDDVLRKALGEPEALVKRITGSIDYDLNGLRKNPRIENVLSRTEILAQSGLYYWAQMSGRELRSLLFREWNQKEKDEALYVSRLLYSAEDFRSGILCTLSIAKADPTFWKQFPEQIFINYPQPYADVYRYQAQKHSVDHELLYSISRQESLFNKDAVSFAGAIGLMQLIPATAKAMALEEGIRTKDLEKRLTDPETNVALGSLYVKKLMMDFKGDEIPVIAAYNAGEYVVEKWLKYRPYEDPYLWIELIPFLETRHYVTAVLHNYYIYKFLKTGLGTVVLKRSIDYKGRAQLFYREGRGL